MNAPADWQPMETAPKDGTTVRLRFHYPNNLPREEWDTPARYTGWRVGNPWGWSNLVGQSFFSPPTHWRPLQQSHGQSLDEK